MFFYRIRASNKAVNDARGALAIYMTWESDVFVSVCKFASPLFSWVKKSVTQIF